MNLHNINWGNFMVDLMILLDIGAFVAYSMNGEWKKAFYWFASTLIMIAVRIL